MQISKVHRVIKLIVVLQGGRAKTVEELMNELGVSRRTLFRDLNMLEAAGVPYYHEKGVGYRLGKEFFMPPISLTAAETLGLMILGKSAAAQRDKPMFASALSGIYKLISSMPEPMRSACGEMMSGVSIDVGAHGYGESEIEHYAILHRCVDEGRVCRLHYKSPVEKRGFWTTVHPYVLHYAARAWYLFAWTEKHQEVRVLKLARISDIEVLDERFERPSDFAVGNVLDGAWALNPEGRVYDVELEFKPLVATNIAETCWHPTQHIKMRPDGSCVARFHVNGLNEIAWWICGYADQVIVRKPDQLREIVLERMKRAVDNFSSEVALT
ncbi:HTH domain protein [Poriferisphaera corsica]|uniref:HTH domain protein n=1 Tax=Poriferisphaera corsica TaxID=2528020 RepID=A0A517YRD1_9BACT|nr:WYL domain-containing protein [Poriferisphaera corsica]QDU32786.1 HTH domain protein [Poriferisphaera corsica]